MKIYLTYFLVFAFIFETLFLIYKTYENERLNDKLKSEIIWKNEALFEVKIKQIHLNIWRDYTLASDKREFINYLDSLFESLKTKKLNNEKFTNEDLAVGLALTNILPQLKAQLNKGKCK